MLSCSKCGSSLVCKTVDNYHYTECGLDDIYLDSVEIGCCENPMCDEEEVRFQNLSEIHDSIAKTLLENENEHTLSQKKFLKKYFEMKKDRHE